MPFRVPLVKAVTYTKAEIDNIIGGATGVAAASIKTSVTVTAGAGWTADTTNPPVPAGETWYYADLVHNLGSAAHPVGAYDINGFNAPWQTHKCLNANTVRVWLAYNPSGNIDFRILA